MDHAKVSQALRHWPKSAPKHYWERMRDIEEREGERWRWPKGGGASARPSKRRKITPEHASKAEAGPSYDPNVSATRAPFAQPLLTSLL